MTVPQVLIFGEKRTEFLFRITVNYLTCKFDLYNAQYIILIISSLYKCIVLVSEMPKFSHPCSLYHRRSRQCRVLVPHLCVPEPVLHQPEARGPQQSRHAHISRTSGTSPPRDHSPGAGGAGLCPQIVSSGLGKCKYFTCTWYNFDDFEAF